MRSSTPVRDSEDESSASDTQLPKAILDRIANFKFEHFFHSKDNWKYYLQRFELEINLLQLNVPHLSSGRRDLLLRAIGSEQYRTVADHFNPIPVSIINYDELLSFLTSHNTKLVSYIFARCEFSRCVHDPNTSIAEFLAKLRSLAPDCQFGAFLDERLRDQFLIGLNNLSMIERISELHRLPTDKLVDIVNFALNIEIAQHQRAAFETNLVSNPAQASSTLNQVNLVQMPQSKKNNLKSTNKRADSNNTLQHNQNKLNIMQPRYPPTPTLHHIM